MYEQDIQLARLLINKLDEMTSRQEELITELKQVQGEFIESERVREERSGYEDVLAQAAALLDRPDLKRETPQTGDLQERVETLKLELSALDDVIEKHNMLVVELTKRAPSLLEAARHDIDSPSTEAGTAEVSAEDQPDEDEEPSAPGVPVAPAETAEPEAATDTATADEDTADSTAEPVAESAPDKNPLEQVFTLKDLKVKETYTFGRGASYLIDASSVLDRVPHYDLHFRAMSESEARDELISDIDNLSCELSGDFYLIFNSWHQPQVDFSNKIEIRNVFGDDEGIKSAANDLIRELAGEMVAREKVVCVVTGDSDLSSAVGGQGVHVISLSEFFVS